MSITEATVVGLFPPTLPPSSINELIIVTDALMVACVCVGFLITEHPVGFQLAPDIWIKKKKERNDHFVMKLVSD